MSDRDSWSAAEIAEATALAEARLHIMQAIDDALERWPEVAALVGGARSTRDLESQLRSLLDIDEMQANAVMDMQLRGISAERRLRVRASVDELKAEIAGYGSRDRSRDGTNED